MDFIYEFIHNPKLDTLKKLVKSIRQNNQHINDFTFINLHLVHIRQPYDCIHVSFTKMAGNPHVDEKFIS